MKRGWIGSGDEAVTRFTRQRQAGAVVVSRCCELIGRDLRNWTACSVC